MYPIARSPQARAFVVDSFFGQRSNNCREFVVYRTYENTTSVPLAGENFRSLFVQFSKFTAREGWDRGGDGGVGGGGEGGQVGQSVGAGESAFSGNPRFHNVTSV